MIEELQRQITAGSQSKEIVATPSRPESTKSESKPKKKEVRSRKKKKKYYGKAAANARSSDLTKWMEKNGVFDKQLHSVLISQHISTLAQLKELKQNPERFEKIIRVARTEMIAKVKNQRRVKSIDEMLVKFERAWRKRKYKKVKHSKK